MSNQVTAWFGNGHPAESFRCTTCGARPKNPCAVTTPMPGTCVGSDMPVRGLHAARVELAAMERAA